MIAAGWDVEDTLDYDAAIKSIADECGEGCWELAATSVISTKLAIAWSYGQEVVSKVYHRALDFGAELWREVARWHFGAFDLMSWGML